MAALQLSAWKPLFRESGTEIPCWEGPPAAGGEEGAWWPRLCPPDPTFLGSSPAVQPEKLHVCSYSLQISVVTYWKTSWLSISLKGLIRVFQASQKFLRSIHCKYTLTLLDVNPIALWRQGHKTRHSFYLLSYFSKQATRTTQSMFTV